MMKRSPLLSITDIAKRLGVSRPTVYSYRDRHGLPLTKNRITEAAFAEWRATFVPPKGGAPKDKPHKGRKIPLELRPVIARRFWRGEATTEELAVAYGVKGNRIRVIVNSYREDV